MFYAIHILYQIFEDIQQLNYKKQGKIKTLSLKTILFQQLKTAWINFRITYQSGAECLRGRLRSRAVKRAYFALAYTAMHAHPVRRRTAPVSYVRRHAPYGALYGYCIKIFQFLFLSNFTAPNAMFMPRRVNKLPHNYQSGTE